MASCSIAYRNVTITIDEGQKSIDECLRLALETVEKLVSRQGQLESADEEKTCKADGKEYTKGYGIKDGLGRELICNGKGEWVKKETVPNS